MYSGTSGLTSPGWVKAYERYVGDSTHPRHKGVIVGPRRSFENECMADRDFLKACTVRHNKFIKRGVA